MYEYDDYTCDLRDGYKSEYKYTIRNNTAAKLSVYTISRFFDVSGSKKAIDNFPLSPSRVIDEGKEYSGVNGFLSYCGGIRIPPDKEMAYSVDLFKLTKEDVSAKHFLAIGGTKKDFDANVRQDVTIPPGTQILEPDGLLFTPGKQRIQELGLVAPSRGSRPYTSPPPRYSKDTVIYTSLDENKCPYIGDRCYNNKCYFELILTINGMDTTSDFVWDHTGDYAYGTKTDKNGICIAPTDVSSRTSNSNPAIPPGQGKATNPATLLLPQSGSSVRHDTGQLQQSK